MAVALVIVIKQPTRLADWGGLLYITVTTSRNSVRVRRAIIQGSLTVSLPYMHVCGMFCDEIGKLLSDEWLSEAMVN